MMINRCDRVGAIGFMGEFPDFKIPKFEIEAYNQRFREANVIINASATHIHYPEHWGGLSIKCCFHGHEYYRRGHSLYRVDDSSFLIFNEGSLYSSWIEDTKRVESFSVNMSPGFEREATSALLGSGNAMIDDPHQANPVRLHFLECLYEHGGDVTALLMEMRSLAHNLPVNHLRLEELFFEVFAAMNLLQIKTHFPPAHKQPGAAATTELYQRLLRARDFMHSCFEEDLSLSDIGRVACLNKFHFLRQFKKAFGITPHQFLTQKRIAAARERLAQTNESIITVAQNVGYTDAASFSKLFKRSTGQSPAAYRKVNFRHNA